MEDKKLTFKEELALLNELCKDEKKVKEILKNIPIEEELDLLKKIKDKKDKKLNIPIEKESVFLNICFDVFECGIETGKKIALDVEGKLKSPKKGTVFFECFEFDKIYKDVIEKYCNENNQKY